MDVVKRAQRTGCKVFFYSYWNMLCIRHQIKNNNQKSCDSENEWCNDGETVRAVEVLLTNVVDDETEILLDLIFSDIILWLSYDLWVGTSPVALYNNNTICFLIMLFVSGAFLNIERTLCIMWQKEKEGIFLFNITLMELL